MSNDARLALSDTEVEEILGTSKNRAILVGGQALALWANYYQVTLPAVLTAHVTRDADFIGSVDTALLIKSSLKNKNWKFARVLPGALTAVTAQLTLQTEQGIKEIDFLRSIIGVQMQDIQRRAVAITLASGHVVTVLHPLDVLASRLGNLAEIPEKRDEKGVSQARLAIDIAGAFLRESASQRPERELFNQIERIRMILMEHSVASVCRQFRLDVLACVPLVLIKNANFMTRRWPAIQREVQDRLATVR